VTEEASDKRGKWEERYATRDLSQFSWLTSELPAQLRELLQRDDLPKGAALDVGCGPGTMTVGLTSAFHPTVGFDIVRDAVEAARKQPVPEGARPATFLVASAPDMPFRDGAFAFVLDRGCLHVLPGPAWAPYFDTVQRILQPGGLFQLFAARKAPQGFMARAKKAIGGGGGQGSLVERIQRMAPPSLEPLDVRALTWAEGVRRGDQAYALFRKRA
jgi:SAM-dependent methyltransferase